MQNIIGKSLLAPAGSTGNNTHTAVQYARGGDLGWVAFQFVVEAVGATPTVTFKFQGSLDNVNWYDILYVTDGSDTASAATRAVTAVGASLAYLDNSQVRQYKFFRCVTTANTNVTYHAELYAENG